MADRWRSYERADSASARNKQLSHLHLYKAQRLYKNLILHTNNPRKTTPELSAAHKVAATPALAQSLPTSTLPFLGIGRPKPSSTLLQNGRHASKGACGP
jgi:hypothetical protein